MLAEINWSAIWVWCVIVYSLNFVLRMARRHPDKRGLDLTLSKPSSFPQPPGPQAPPARNML
jgi:hypothetical protein